MVPVDVKHHVYLLVLAQSPGEIKRREVSWTLTKKLDLYLRVQARSGGRRLLDPQVSPEEIKRREIVLDPQVSPKEIKSREEMLGSESWTSFAAVVSQQQCYGHCLCDSAPHSN